MAVKSGRKIIRKDEIKVGIYFIGVIWLIFFLQTRHINHLYAPWVNNDEIGYWGNAAYFAGYDWSDILKYSEYYSYGYGIILAPLFWIFKNPVMLYRAAILFNVFFLIIVFVIAYSIIREIYNEINKYMSITIALISTLTSGAMIQAETAWSETFILLLTWLIFFFFMKYIISQKMRYLLSFILCNIAIYITHQRMLGIVLASVLIMGYCVYKKMIPQKHIAILLGLILLGIFLATIQKENLQRILWESENSANNSQSISMNDYDGQIVKIISIFSSGKNFALFLKGVLGKIFYFAYASYFLLLMGIYFFIQKVRKHQNSTEEVLFYFILLSIAGMLVITSVFMCKPGRNDTIIYGRYAESLVGPMILTGICNLLLVKEKTKISMIIIGIAVLLEVGIIFMVKYQMWDLERETFTIMIPAMTRYIVGNEFYIAKFLKESIIVGFVLVTMLVIYKRKVIISSILCFAFIFLAYQNESNLYNWHIKPLQEEKKEILKLIKNNQDMLERKEEVYFLIQDEFNPDGNRNVIQFAMRDKKIECIVEKELRQSEMSGQIVFVNISNPHYESIEQELKLIEKNDIMAVLVCD